MKNHILKLALGVLALAALGYAGYKFIQQRENRVEVKNYQDPAIQGSNDDQVEIQSRSSSSSTSSSCKGDNQSCQSSIQCCHGLQCASNPMEKSSKTCMTPQQIKTMNLEG